VGKIDVLSQGHIQAHEAPEFRYQYVVDFIKESINSGSLAPAEKAPSLRKGFFVRENSNSCVDTPSAIKRPTRVRAVTTDNEVAAMFGYSSDDQFAPLGCAVPGPELLATSQLDKYLIRAARHQGIVCNTYAPPRGVEALRAVIARRSLNWGQALALDDIIITSGCTEALHLALKTITTPGDTIAVESPNYFGFLPVLQALHLKVTEIPTDSITGLSVEALEGALQKSPIKACLFSSAFNNPLGCLTSEQKKSAILKLLNQYAVPLVEDDIYGDIYFGSDRPRPYSAMPEAEDVIYCSSFSKTVAPGYRIGWVASPTLSDQLLVNKYATTLCGPMLLQVAMAEFLNTGSYDNHLRGLRRAFGANLKSMSAAIAATFPEGTKISRPEGGFVLWIELPGNIDTRDIFDIALSHSICFSPGDLFTTSNNYKNNMRISCGYRWDSRLERAIWKLGDILNTANPVG